MSPGSLLIADPSVIGDNNFHRSIILLVEHDHNGSFGFIINNPLNYTTNDITIEMEGFMSFQYGEIEHYGKKGSGRVITSNFLPIKFTKDYLDFLLD